MNCRKWLIDNRLFLHVGKMESILFGSTVIGNWNMFGTFKWHVKGQLSNVSCMKYLGVALDENLCFDYHISSWQVESFMHTIVIFQQCDIFCYLNLWAAQHFFFINVFYLLLQSQFLFQLLVHLFIVWKFSSRYLCILRHYLKFD